MKIGILTGGGDVPGLNAAIKAVVNMAAGEGHQVLGVRRGWAGLLGVDPSNPLSVQVNTLPLDPGVVRTIDRTGGTFLHTSRTNPAKVRPEDVPGFLQTESAGDAPRDLTAHVLDVIHELGLSAMIAIGGDDTLSFALRLHREGVPVVAIPKTMDNDVHGTDYCIGFSTAVSRTVNFVHQLRTSAGSHERIAVVEVFGRNSGETSLVSAYLSGVDRAVISEVPFDPDRLAELLMRDKKDNPSNYAMMTISEGATVRGGQIVEAGEEDPFGHRKLGGIGQIATELLKERTGQGMIYQQLGYLMRSGSPDSLDLMVATSYALLATELVTGGASGRLVALRDGNYTHVPLTEVGSGLKRVDVEALYDPLAYRPKPRQVDGRQMFLS
ncbi:MAG TPA: 6-phosphofructokinase [Actinomycetota bacterium]|nr:6-phosphofructokinase [Actinomycetota bacterium]